jgi:hypothetical protein
VTVGELVSALVAAFFTVTLMTALLAVAYRRVLRRRLVEELLQLSGPSIIQALSPQQVMTTFLSTLYGDSDANRAFIAGLLGGEGVEPHGSDLTVSINTAVDYELQAVEFPICQLTATVAYSFKKNVADHRFAIFATCDPRLRDRITLACRLPLFESWFIPDRSLFEQSVDAMLPTVQLGIHYTDLDGEHHEVPLDAVQLTEVSYRDWSKFLRFFHEPLGTMPQQDPTRYMGTLRIFECDLYEIADADHAVGSVERLSLRSTTLQSTDEGFCYWQAPYPCYVDRISFRAQELSADGISWLFKVVPFIFQSETTVSGWTPAEQLNDFVVRSWLLPGHGVALMWKPASPALPPPEEAFTP